MTPDEFEKIRDISQMMIDAAVEGPIEATANKISSEEARAIAATVTGTAVLFYSFCGEFVGQSIPESIAQLDNVPNAVRRHALDSLPTMFKLRAEGD